MKDFASRLMNDSLVTNSRLCQFDPFHIKKINVPTSAAHWMPLKIFGRGANHVTRTPPRQILVSPVPPWPQPLASALSDSDKLMSRTKG